ncbi:MAG: alpha/beta fold hydrolase, partial [Bacteroidales bacterium]|nr:alpha/beta fold hydrolase [Bacteroidales bacterium]
MKKFPLTVILPLLLLVGCGRGLEPLHEKVSVDATALLVGDIDRPASSSGKVPMAIILHGLTGDRNEPHLVAVADSLNAAGIATAKFDFNGHGESGGEFVNMTLDNEFEDALAIFGYVSSLPWVDKDRIYLVGHSQGGLEAGIVAGKLGKEKIAKVVLLAPAACICTMAQSGSMFGIDFSTGELPEYIDFWKGTHLGKNYLLSARDMDVYGRTSKYDGPVLILQGLSDGKDLIR